MIKNNNEIVISEEESKICLIDNKKFDSSRKMIWYVRKTYNLSFEDYIIKYYYNNNIPTCLKTGKLLTFKAHKTGPWFSNYSKNNFPRKEHTLESKEKIKNSLKKNTMIKYGVENIFQLDWCKEKIKNTNLQKYNVDNPAKNKEIYDKVKNTNLEKYGVDNPRKNKEINKKIEDTNLKKYGKPTVWGTDHFIKVFKKNFLKKYGVDNPMHVKEFRDKCAEKIKKYMLENFLKNRNNRSNTKPEKQFIEFLKQINEPYVHQFKTKHGIIDFYLPSKKLFIEIDGDYWHREIKENLNYTQLYNSIRDFNKNKNIKKLIRIKASAVKNLKTMDDIYNNQYYQQTSLNFDQKILNKDYNIWSIINKGKEKVEKRLYTLVKFIKLFSPNFPKYVSLETDILKISEYIKKYIIDENNIDYFHWKIPSIGNGYLKNIFDSYWKSSYNKSISPKDLWENEKILYSIIKYRIGCNNSGEVFDFSLKEILKGMSAQRYTISFFKPCLAALIYKKYLGNKITPIVLDPCCGFGGRLLGFKSVYSNGIYIGCEPNTETYNELIILRNNMGYDESTVKLFNCKFEDFQYPLDNIDFTFTSIPYYDLEIYSEKIEYLDFNEWKNTFIYSIENKTKNCYINAPIDICEKLGWTNCVSKIFINSSHFSKDKENKKFENIVKLN